MAVSTPKDWWKSSIVYQIHTRTFCDSNNDGVGDIAGVATRLSYLKNLGVDVIWMSEIFPDLSSTGKYDSLEMKNIDPAVGSMDDMEKLIAKAKRLGIRIIIDFIFDDATSYVNTEDESINRYNKCSDIIQFWMEKGISGFGFNADEYIALEKEYATQYGKLRENVIKTYKPFFIGKTSDCDIKNNQSKIDVEEHELDALVIDEHMKCSSIRIWPFKRMYKPSKLISCLDKWQENIDWPAIYFESFEDSRALNQFGSTDEYRDESAKLIASLNMSLKGVPFIYQGQEVGMTNETESFINHADEGDDIYDYYRRIIEFRKNSTALSSGNYRRVAAPADVFVFTRESVEERFYVYCNLTDQPRQVEVYGDHLVFDSYKLDEVEEYFLKPYEFRIMQSNF